MFKKSIFIVPMLLNSFVQAEEIIADLAQKQGATVCLSTAKELDNFFGGDTNYGAHVRSATNNPNNQPLDITIEQTFNDGNVIVDIDLVPTSDGQCTVSYAKSWYSSKSCMATTQEKFMKDAEYSGTLNKGVSYFHDGDSMVFLTDAGPGCLVVKKEFLVRHKEQDKA